MGIDPAPFFANLYLYYYENKYITNLMHTNKFKALQFKNAMRFIDDEINLNDRGVFGESHADIYPAELELKCEHQGHHATYLDLYISVEDGVFIYKLFDKRDNFPFFIVRMPDLTGNIPNHVFYGSVMSEFLRIARCSMRYEDFLIPSISLFRRMVNQGGRENILIAQVQKAVRKYSSAFQRYSVSDVQIIRDVTK